MCSCLKRLHLIILRRKCAFISLLGAGSETTKESLPYREKHFISFIQILFLGRYVSFLACYVSFLACHVSSLARPVSFLAHQASFLATRILLPSRGIPFLASIRTPFVFSRLNLCKCMPRCQDVLADKQYPRFFRKLLSKTCGFSAVVYSNISFNDQACSVKSARY